MVFNPKSSADINKIIEARHHDPFNVLGFHQHDDESTVRVFLPHTKKAWLDN